VNIRKSYPTDLTDAQWHIIEPLIPPAKHGGRHREVCPREILCAIFYILRSGCAWRLLPHDFPPWQTVYGYFRTWQRAHVWEEINDALREAVRIEAGREAQPSMALIDSQSVKTTSVAGERGVDPFKSVKGRKRHILVDTMGLILAVVVHTANMQDRKGARLVLARALAKGFERLELILADGGYESQPLLDWLAARIHWVFELVKRPEGQKGFVVQAQKWVVERTFAWLGRYRRLSKDYEVLPESSEAFVYIAMIHLMLKRLANNPRVWV
jgi:putative transposase